MNEHEFVYKLIHDREYVREVADKRWDIETPDQDDPGAMSRALKVATDRLGLELDEDKLRWESEEQIKALGHLQALKVVVRIGRAMSAARRAHGVR